MLTATKIRIYPNANQTAALSKVFGSTRWLWNNSLAKSQETYKETGKGLSHFALNNRLPEIKKDFQGLIL
jgi:putative transposase